LGWKIIFFPGLSLNASILPKNGGDVKTNGHQISLRIHRQPKISKSFSRDLTNGLPNPLILEGPGAVSINPQSLAPVIDGLFAQISMALQYPDEGFHPVLPLHLFDKIEAPEIDRPFNDRFRIGSVAVSVPKEFFSHLTNSSKKTLMPSQKKSRSTDNRCFK
jgi:hypothetical protein